MPISKYMGARADEIWTYPTRRLTPLITTAKQSIPAASAFEPNEGFMTFGIPSAGSSIHFEQWNGSVWETIMLIYIETRNFMYCRQAPSGVIGRFRLFNASGAAQSVYITRTVT